MQKIDDFQKQIGYQFKDMELLELALTHSSCTNENRSHQNNQRLEFLGDSVLSMVVADFLYNYFPKKAEGDLTKIRASLVCDRSLEKFGNKIELGRYLLLGKGEELSGGRTRMSNIEDAFEALVGAIYLDGGLQSARDFVYKFIPGQADMEHLYRNVDYKTTLQEIIQKNPEEEVSYVLTGESGPDHDKRFEAEVHLNSNVIGKGEGRSKKQAEQMAAKQALALMGYDVEEKG